MSKRILGALVVLLLICPFPVYGDSAFNTVQKHVTRVTEILKDQSLKDESAKEVKKTKIRAVTDQMFDFDELSRRTLARNWERLNPAQQKEFIKLYREILENAYMEKILSYSNERILFLRENMSEKERAEVTTKIVTQAAEISIDYQLIQKDDKWKVYDVAIEGVSLVNNYRSQFREILASKSPEEMLQILRKKVSKI